MIILMLYIKLKKEVKYLNKYELIIAFYKNNN